MQPRFETDAFISPITGTAGEAAITASRSAATTATIHARWLASVGELSRAQWDALFPGRAENWGYFRACERSGHDGVTTAAIAAFFGETLVAAAPLFETAYHLDMALPGPLQKAAAVLRRVAPSLLKKSIVSIGSPWTEECPVGLHPALNIDQRATAFSALVAGMERHADANGIALRVLKDVEDRDAEWMTPILARLGYARAPNLPVAILHLPFESEAAYLASLSSNMRRDLKRKMRSADKVQVEICHSIAGIEDEITALFLETKARSKAEYAGFDDVPADYFRNVVAALGDRALIVLTRVDGVLASFSISLMEDNRVIGKYLGMRYPLATEHNVYFINWMVIVRLCIARGIRWLQTGQTTYNQKTRLGCKLKRSWIFFKHRGTFTAAIVRAVGSRLRFDTLDPDLKDGDARMSYIGSDAPASTLSKAA